MDWTDLRGLTPRQVAILRVLAVGPKHPFELYPVLCPNGKYIGRDPGSAKGGPGRTEVPVNFFMNRGEMKRYARREALMNNKGRHVAQGAYEITSDGRKALAKFEEGRR